MTAAIRIATLAVAVVVLGYSAATSALAQDVTLSVDADASGNSATSLGSIQNCLSVNTDDTFDVDIVVTDVEALTGFEFDLLFDPQILQVTAIDDRMLLVTTPGSNIVSFTDSPPGPRSGSFLAAAADFGEMGTTEETGSGVLVRLTFKALSTGTSSISINDPKLAATVGSNPAVPVGPAEGDIFIGPVFAANVAVGQSCTPPPAPTPHPSLTTTDGTPAPGATPGEPGGEPTTPFQIDIEETVERREAPSTSGGQETLVGTLAPDEEATVIGRVQGEAVDGENDIWYQLDDGSFIYSGALTLAGADEEDGGLSTVAWVGIGVGIAVAALAAAGGGWQLLRRRRGAP